MWTLYRFAQMTRETNAGQVKAPGPPLRRTDFGWIFTLTVWFPSGVAMIVLTRLILLVSVILILAVGGFSGCSKSDPVSVPPLIQPPSLAGRWDIVGSGGFAMTMQNKQRGVAIEGSVSAASGGSTIVGSVYGNCAYPNVSLTLTFPGYYAIKFSGTLQGASSLSGVLNESGFSNFPVTGTKR
jgi:hypothetical protein